jgi:hypothetical protein
MEVNLGEWKRMEMELREAKLALMRVSSLVDGMAIKGIVPEEWLEIGRIQVGARKGPGKEKKG